MEMRANCDRRHSPKQAKNPYYGTISPIEVD